MAKKRKFKCSKCEHRFSMAAHLARHMSTIHASKRANMAKKKRTAATTRAMRPVRDGFGGLVEDLRACRMDIAAQKAQIESRIQGIDSALAALGAGTAKPVVARRKRGKGPRAGSLKDYIGRVLRGLVKGKSVKDITAAVMKAGYKSKSKDLTHAVSKALVVMKNAVRVGHGVYRLK